ncbi:Hypothetical predicted protein, partial [Paramuricea clavata]
MVKQRRSKQNGGSFKGKKYQRSKKQKTKQKGGFLTDSVNYGFSDPYNQTGGIVQGEWSRRPMGLSPGATFRNYRQRGAGKKQQGGFLPLLL